MQPTPVDYPDPVLKRIDIAATPDAVWRALTDPALAQRWMSDEPLQLDTDRRVGGAIKIGVLHGSLRFANTGRVRAFEPPRRLEHTFHSSLSRPALPDTPEHHVVFRFELEPAGVGTQLRLSLSNFSDYTV